MLKYLFDLLLLFVDIKSIYVEKELPGVIHNWNFLLSNDEFQHNKKVYLL